MSNQVPEWVHYGDGIGAVIVDYASKGIVLFTIFGLPILFFVVWAIDSNTYHKRQLAADEVTKLKRILNREQDLKETASTAALTTLYTFGWSMKLKRISTKWDIMNCVLISH